MLDPRTFVRSITRGRARIRHAALRGISPSDVEGLSSMIRSMEGVTSVEINPRVGSALVTWDESKTNAEALLAAAAFFLPGDEADEAAEPADASASDAVPAAPAASEPASGCACRKAVKSAAAGALSVAQDAAESALRRVAPLVAPKGVSNGRMLRVTQNRLMLSACAISVATLFVKSPAAHAALGLLFTGFLAVHLYQHRTVL